jgi:hypothetical protein
VNDDPDIRAIGLHARRVAGTKRRESDHGTGLLRGRARGVAARIRGRMAMRWPSAPGACRVQCGPRMPASGRMLKN